MSIYLPQQSIILCSTIRSVEDNDGNDIRTYIRINLYNNPSHLLPIEAPTKTQLKVWQVGQLGIVST